MSANHHRASVDEIERVRFTDVEHTLCRMKVLPGVTEAMVLQTCNRVEVYMVSEDPLTLKKFASDEGFPTEVLKFYADDECLMHLLKLACGLESMIIGEDQILGQLKSAYLLSEKQGAMGIMLSTAVLKAINVGKRARLETRINKGSVSIGSAAVDLAESMLGALDGMSILVVGAGEMGVLVANALAEKHLKGIYVANRTFEQAEKLASDLGGTAVRLDDIGEHLGTADVIICATAAPHTIISRDMVEKKLGVRNGKRLLIIDITNPRNVEETVGDLRSVDLHNIDSLRRISDDNLKKRRAEVAQVECIIDEELVLLKRDYKRQRADQVICDIYQKTDNLRLVELNRAITRLSSSGDLSEKQVRILSDFSLALTSKILAGPTKALRHAAEAGDEEHIRAARELFDLDIEEGKDELSYNKAKAVKTE